MKKFKSLLTISMAVLMLLSCAMGWGCSKPSAVDSDDREAFSEQTGDAVVSEMPGDPIGTDPMLDSLPMLPIRTLVPDPTPAPETQNVSDVPNYATSTPNTDVMEVPAPGKEPPEPVEQMVDVPYVPGYTNEVYVNFRSGPSTSAEIIRVCRQGTELMITGKTSEWFRVEIGDVEGYIARPYVTVGYLPTPKPAPVSTPKPPSNPSNPSNPSEPMYTVYPGQFSDSDIRLVAALIYSEGRGSSHVGLRAIASIVLNRVLNGSGKFPNTVSGVIFQSGQFGYSKSYLQSVNPSSAALSAAEYVFSTHGSTLPKKVLFYRAAYLGTSWYSYTRYYATIEGNCYFYGITYF